MPGVCRGSSRPQSPLITWAARSASEVSAFVIVVVWSIALCEAGLCVVVRNLSTVVIISWFGLWYKPNRVIIVTPKI